MKMAHGTMALSITVIAVLVMARYTTSQILHSAINFVDSPSIQIPNFDSYQDAPDGLAHPVVIENSLREMELHPSLLNSFYKNPIIAAGLAKESLIQNKEFPVYNRETEKINRSEVFKIFQRARYFQNRRK